MQGSATSIMLSAFKNGRTRELPMASPINVPTTPVRICVQRRQFKQLVEKRFNRSFDLPGFEIILNIRAKEAAHTYLIQQ
ncbi:hypothetical protein Ddc_21939 [Ditylenchus destructor]|nr:hypothetical protein Ddc_21939 [Ditylenchus destructor]